MKRRASGQAMVEFVISIFAVLVLAAALLTIGLLSRADTDAMTTAQEKAARDSLHGSIGNSFNPDPSLSDAVFAASHADWTDATGSSVLPDGDFKALSHGAGSEVLNMQKGTGVEEVEVPDIAVKLLSTGETAAMKEEVWFPSLSL